MKFEDAEIKPLLSFLQGLEKQYDDEFWSIVAEAAKLKDDLTLNKSRNVDRKRSAVNGLLGKLVMVAWPKDDIQKVYVHFNNVLLKSLSDKYFSSTEEREVYETVQQYVGSLLEPQDA